MHIHSDPRRSKDATALPDVEIFYHPGKVASSDGTGFLGEEYPKPGWYYQYGFPGCLPAGEPEGPFETYEKATRDLYYYADNDSNYEDNE